MYTWLESRKLRAAIVALITIFLTAWVSGEAVDPNVVIAAVATIASVLMGSIAHEDAARSRALVDMLYAEGDEDEGA
jgi:hypothetical protein